MLVGRKSLELRNIASGQLLLPAVTEDLAQVGRDEIVVDIKAARGGPDSVAREMDITSSTLFDAGCALVLSKYADSSTITFGVVLYTRSANQTQILHLSSCIRRILFGALSEEQLLLSCRISGNL